MHKYYKGITKELVNLESVDTHQEFMASQERVIKLTLDLEDLIATTYAMWLAERSRDVQDTD